MTPDEWRQRGDYFSWRGYPIFYRTEGTGEPLLLVHGFPTGSWDWYAIWPELARRYRVLALDMIGFGFSAKPRDFDYTIMAQADLFEAFLAREKVGAHRLLAHDYGLSVTQELLARNANIRSLVLLNGGLFPETHRATPAQKILASRIGPWFAKLSSYRTFAMQMRAIWGTTPAPEAELRGMWQLITENDGMGIMAKLIDYMRQRREHRDRWVGALVAARMPIRLIDGLRDPVSGPKMVARFRELVPQGDVIELPDVGHYPQVEAPKPVLDGVLEHFNRTAS